MRFLFLCIFCAHFDRFPFHYSRVLRPAALLSKCPKGLAAELRLNRIITELILSFQNICDEQLKAPAGRIAAVGVEGAGVGRGRPS